MTSLSEMLESPARAVAIIAIVAILGLVSIGIISFFCQAKTADTLTAVVKTLDGVLMIGLGAKAGLAIPGNQNGNGKRKDDNPDAPKA
jgi:hypothetical protein